MARLTADMPDGPGDALTWEIDALVLVRGRLLQLQCFDHGDVPLAVVPALRATTLGWVDRVRAANREPSRGHGRIRSH